jgi:hypothetical protein
MNGARKFAKAMALTSWQKFAHAKRHAAKK